MLTGAHIFGLHKIILCVYIAGGIFVVGAMFYTTFAHRRTKRPDRAHFHESTLVEFIWTAIPILILLGVVIPTATTIWNNWGNPPAIAILECE